MFQVVINCGYTSWCCVNMEIYVQRELHSGSRFGKENNILHLTRHKIPYPSDSRVRSLQALAFADIYKTMKKIILRLNGSLIT